MLVFSAQSLAFIAVPKTGTTAIEMALKPKADFILGRRYKHMTARQYHRKIAPFLDREFDVRPDIFAVMRDPVEQIRSWFRYRTRALNAAKGNDTTGKSFDEFVAGVIAEDSPAFARIGSQFNMLTSSKGEVLVHHLFAHQEGLANVQAFASERFGEDITFKQRNVSPKKPAPLDPALHKKLVASRAAEFDLFTRVMDAGGHLQSVMP